MVLNVVVEATVVVVAVSVVALLMLSPRRILPFMVSMPLSANTVIFPVTLLVFVANLRAS